MNKANKIGVTSLMLAVQAGHDHVARALIEAKGDLEKQEPDGCTALMISAQFGADQVRSTQLD